MTRGSDGVWYCSECDYRTKYSTTLTRHVEAKHMQTSGFECSICQQFCPTRNSLMSHQYRKHDVRYAQSWSINLFESPHADTIEDLNILVENIMFKNDDGCWQCKECQYNSRKISHMQNHIEAKHVSTSGFSCLICHKHCPTRHAMMNHKSRYHKQE